MVKMFYPVVTVTLNPAIDKSVIVENFRPGSGYRCREVHECAGGKGINVSRALKLLNVPNLALVFVAGHSGEFIRQSLRDEKVSAKFVMTAGYTRTSLTIIDAKSRRSTRILEPGPDISSREARSFQQMFERNVPRCRYVVLSGRNAVGLPDDFYGRLIRIARRFHKPVILDTSGIPLKEALRQKPFCCKPNRKEAENLLGYRLKTPGQLKKGLKKILSMGVKEVIISLAAEGAVASNGKDWLWARPPASRVVNSVGCGDALVAGYLASRLRGMSFAENLRFAVAAGSANAVSLQPGRLSPSLARQLVREVSLKTL